MKIRVDEVYMGKFEEKMAKLAKIADKLGVPAPTFEIVETENVEVKEHGKVIGTYKSFIIEITGDAPKIVGDWEFVAKVDHEENLIYSVRPLPVYYTVAADLKCRCEHCNTNRYRAKTFIVTNGNEHLQVGGSCLKNYMGHANPNNMVQFFDELNELADEKEFRGGSSNIIYQPLHDVICVAMYAIKNFGYVKDSYSDTPTKAVVSNIFYDARSAIRPSDCVAEYSDKVGECMMFMETIKPFGDGSYAANVKQIVKNGDVSPKAIGIATSAVFCYLREVEKKAKEAIDNKIKAESNHVGSVGERLRDVSVTVTNCRVFETFYGCSTLVAMTDSNGNVFTWFASGVHEYEIGEKIEITGTIKAHDEYKGTKQTVLTRCKVK